MMICTGAGPDSQLLNLGRTPSIIIIPYDCYFAVCESLVPAVTSGACDHLREPPKVTQNIKNAPKRFVQPVAEPVLLITCYKVSGYLLGKTNGQPFAGPVRRVNQQYLVCSILFRDKVTSRRVSDYNVRLTFIAYDRIATFS
jgi:hypothetical protein